MVPLTPVVKVLPNHPSICRGRVFPTQIARLSFDFKSMSNARNHVIKRIPKICRQNAARCLMSLIKAILDDNCETTWKRLLLFASCCLVVPRRGGRRAQSKAALINKQIESFLKFNNVSASTPLLYCPQEEHEKQRQESRWHR